MCTHVVNFSPTDRDFSGKIDPCFFRQKRSAFFIVKSRSGSRLKIVPEKTGSVFYFKTDERFSRPDRDRTEKGILRDSNLRKGCCYGDSNPSRERERLA